MADEVHSTERPLALEEVADLLIAKTWDIGRIRREKPYATRMAEREATMPALAQLKDLAPLDRRNRDPSYWTPERKQRLRSERLARLHGKK